MADLYLNSKDFEAGHFYTQPVEPTPHILGWRWLFRLVRWSHLYTQDGGKGAFFSVTLFWFLHFYKGTAKCDGTRTYMLRSGQLGEPAPAAPAVVMTDLPKELLAFRFRRQGMAAVPTWDGMGSC